MKHAEPATDTSQAGPRADAEAPAEARPRVERVKSLKRMRTEPNGDGSRRSEKKNPMLADETAVADEVNDFVKEDVAKGNAEGYFTSFDADNFVESPGSAQTIAQLYVFLLQKLSLYAHVNIAWPAWFRRLFEFLAILELEIPFDVFGLPLPSASVLTAQLLFAPALIARFVFVGFQYDYYFSDDTPDEDPQYSTTAETLRTIVVALFAPGYDGMPFLEELLRLMTDNDEAGPTEPEEPEEEGGEEADSCYDVAFVRCARCAVVGIRFVPGPALLSAVAIGIGVPSQTDWLTGLGVMLWPVIGYLLVVQLLRARFWKACQNKHANKPTAYFWNGAKDVEQSVLVFLYFAAFLTGIGGLLERLGAGNSFAVQAVCAPLLFLYIFVPCFLCLALRDHKGNDLMNPKGYPPRPAPDDEDEYKEWLQELLADEGPQYTIIASFEKKYAWFKAILLLEAAAFACSVMLPRYALTKLVSASVFSSFFAVIACVTRPYLEDIEDYTDLAGRAFVLVTLGVGIGLEKGPGPDGRLACSVILGIITLVANGMYLVVLNPLRLISGVRAAIGQARAAARVARWHEDTIKSLPPDELKSITAADVEACTFLQIYWFMRHQSAALELGAFQEMEMLDLSDEDLDEPAVDEVMRLLAPLATTLKEINVNNNMLGGTITNDFGVFKELVTLELENAGVEGPPLPETLHILAALAPTLKELNLNRNLLGGTISAEIMNFTKLTDLNLRETGLEGPPLHETLRMLKPLAPTLEGLCLDDNDLGGRISADILVFTSLTLVGLENVGAEGPPLHETMQMLLPLAPNLRELNLKGNKLGGMITSDIAAFRGLTYLDVKRMNLEGTAEERQARIKELLPNLPEDSDDSDDDDDNGGDDGDDEDERVNRMCTAAMFDAGFCNMHHELEHGGGDRAPDSDSESEVHLELSSEHAGWVGATASDSESEL